MGPPVLRADPRALARDPRTWAVVARHALPVVGALALGWSAAEALVAIVLDTLASVWCVGAIASWYATIERGAGKPRAALVREGVVTFALVALVLAVPVAVPAVILWASVLAKAGVEASELVRSASLWSAFGLLALLQTPRFAAFVAANDPESARRAIEPETGFLLRRLILVSLACSWVSFLSGDALLLGGLAAAQVALAAHELLGDRLFAPAPAPPVATAAPRARRRGRRR